MTVTVEKPLNKNNVLFYRGHRDFANSNCFLPNQKKLEKIRTNQEKLEKMMLKLEKNSKNQNLIRKK